MWHLKKIVFCIGFIFLFISSIYATDYITLKVGETQNRKLYIYNPSTAMTDLLDLTLSSTGSVNAWITTTQGNRMNVQVLPKENKSIPITIIATGCTQNPCEGTVDFFANSSITGNSVSKQITVSIQSKQARGFLGTAPDLNWSYLVLIALVGAIISISIHKIWKK